VLPEPIGDERQWMLEALNRWTRQHRRPPRQRDWSKAQDPDRGWPRWNRVAELFEAEAIEKGLRYFRSERCAGNCPCSFGRHYSNGLGDDFCDGCFDCLGHCPHGPTGEWIGPSGWQYALQVAGLELHADR
jgi:hypothetical protein